MKIPLIYADKPYEVVHTPNVGVGEMAEAQVGGEVVELSGLIAQRQAVLQDKERRAQEEIRAVKADVDMNERMSKEVESFLKNPDYESYDARRDEFLKSLRDEFAPKEDASNESKLAFARSFRNVSGEFNDFVRSRKFKLMNDTSISLIKDLVIQKAQKYATLSDPLDRKLLIKNTELDIRKLMDTGAVNPLVGENEIRDIEKTFKAIDENVSKASAVNRMDTEPAQLAIDLKNPKYLPGWTDELERAQMARQAETAARIQSNEREAKRKEALVEAEKAEKIAIGNDVLKKDYTSAFAKLASSKTITNKIEIGNQIRAASEHIAPIDPVKNALNIIKANDMISGGEDPNKIRDFVVFNPDFKDKEQYITKLESKMTEEVKEGRKRAYKDIVQIIFPRAFDIIGLAEGTKEVDIDRLLNFSKISPEQVLGISRTQMALDAWINEQIRGGRYPSSDEIINKGHALVGAYQMSIGEKVDFWRKQGTQ